MTQDKPLKALQHNAIRLLAQGETQKNVAQILNISPMTVSRWNNLPNFQTQLQTVTASESGLEALARKSNATALTAVENLQEVLAGVHEPLQVRLQAAQIILRCLPAINAAMERGLKHRRADFLLEQRWERGNIYDSHCDLIPPACPGANSSIRNLDGSVAV